jgi:hypothetical protein
MTAVDEQTDAIGHLDFEDPCTASPGCERPADFSAHCLTCDFVHLTCGHCLNRSLALDTKWQCSSCGRREKHLLDLVRIRPLLKHSS